MMSAGENIDRDALLEQHVSIFAVDPRISERPIRGKVCSRLRSLEQIVLHDSGRQLSMAYAVRLDEPLEFYDFLSQPKTTEITQVALVFWSEDDYRNLIERGQVRSCDIHLYATGFGGGEDGLDPPSGKTFGLSKEVEVAIEQQSLK